MAMAHGVEGRFPFLDHRVVEAAARIPPRMKLKGLQEKAILRKAAEGAVPETIAKRPKQPYRAPENQSFFGKAALGYVERLFSAPAIGKTGLFDRPAVEKLVAKCRAGRSTGFRENTGLVGVLSTQLWIEEFVSKPEVSAVISMVQAVA